MQLNTTKFFSRLYQYCFTLTFVLTFTLANQYSYSQFDIDKVGGKSLLEDEIKSSFNSNINQPNNLPVGNDIDINYYYPGPGDVLLLKILPISNKEEYIEITPDNLLILPRNFGEINTKNKTLAVLKLEIEELLNKQIKDFRIVLTIKNPRSCIIIISGNVSIPGTYVFPSTYRISTILNYLNKVSSDDKSSMNSSMNLDNIRRKNEFETTYLSSGVSSKAYFSTRNISLIRNDGRSLNVDLERFYASNDYSQDPHIKEGDKIYVPFEETNFPTISISGEIIRPYTLEFKKDDKLSFLLKCGAGLKSTADINKVYFYNSTGEKVLISIDKEMNLLSQDYNLSPGCFVVVEKSENYINNRNGLVSLKGQVNNEGIFQINNNQTTLKELIESAGGVKDNASLDNSYVLRRNTQNNSYEDKRKEFLDYFQNSDLTLEDTSRFMLDLLNKKPYVSCDFNIALKPNNKSEELFLEDGDVIYIAEKQNKIYVFGKVKKPGFVTFDETKNYEWFIQKAGGFTSIAENNRTRIIRGNNKIWLDPQKYPLQDGDYIYVPGEPDIPKQVSDQQYGLYASVLGALASLTFLIINVFRK